MDIQMIVARVSLNNFLCRTESLGFNPENEVSHLGDMRGESRSKYIKFTLIIGDLNLSFRPLKCCVCDYKCLMGRNQEAKHHSFDIYRLMYLNVAGASHTAHYIQLRTKLRREILTIVYWIRARIYEQTPRVLGRSCFWRQSGRNWSLFFKD